MSCCKPVAEQNRRGMTLIEVMISQTIAIIVISAMMAVVVAMVNKLQSEVATSDAQVHLRQVTHLLLRDTQGIGSSSGASAGDFILINDGGSSAPDSFTLFRRDESVCGGGIPLNAGNSNSGNTLNPDTTSGCPFALSTCPPAELAGRTLMVVGDSRSAQMTGHTVNASSCEIKGPTGQQATNVVSNYNARYSATMSNINQVFGDMVPVQILAGSGFTYRVDRGGGRNMLQRSTDDGVTFVDILDNVLDLQVQRVFMNGDVIEYQNEPATGAPEDFIGLRIGLVTFARANDGLSVPPPATFGNRTLTGSPGNRRYRASFVITAARNRSGA